MADDAAGLIRRAGANPGGDKADPAAEDVEAKLNNPFPNPKKIALCFTDDAEGREAAKDTVERLKAAVAAGTIPTTSPCPRRSSRARPGHAPCCGAAATRTSTRSETSGSRCC
jgi:hypothetical protein